MDSRYPNLALMKISRYHKAHGDKVEWYTPFSEGHYDRVYMSKIFTFTQDYEYPINNAEVILRGGTGYDLTARLPDEIDRLQPDYTIYNVPYDPEYEPRDPEEDYWDWLEAEEGRREETRIKDEFENQ